MRLIDGISYAARRLENKLNEVFAMLLGTLASIEPEMIRLPPDSNELEDMTATAAYYRASQRGFVSGYELSDWLEAEKEVLEHFAAGGQEEMEV